MSKRQRDRKRREVRAWCYQWFGLPYNPIPQRLRPAHPRPGDGIQPIASATLVRVRVTPLDDNHSPTGPQQQVYLDPDRKAEIVTGTTA